MDDDRLTQALQSLVAAIAQRGPGAVNPPKPGLLAELGLSQAAFWQLFGDGEGALLAAFDFAVERARGVVVPVFANASGWLDGVRSTTAAFLRFVDEEPELGRVLVLSGLGGGERLARRRLEMLEDVVDAIDAGNEEQRAGIPRQPRVIAEGVVGALSTVLRNDLLQGRSADPIELYGSLVSIAVHPYLGAAAARRELERPPPQAPGSGSRTRHPAASTAGRRGRRLTYRSAQVLVAIEAQPGASNREVAERAGIVDQGQASKLLGRLRDAGLVECRRRGIGRGGPNSWHLTDAGRAAMRQGEVVPW